MSEIITPSQTVGPFFAYGLTPKGRAQWDPNGTYSWKETVNDNLVTPDASGEKIHIEGCITDGDGKPISDAMIEIWQADSQGRYANPRDNRALPNTQFKGFGRSATNKDGVYGFDTIKPGTVPGPGGKPQAPHIVFCIFSRGMLRQIYTRLYFSDEKANDADPVLSLVPPGRRGTLIAHKEARGGATVYRFDIRVQGKHETVFFDI
jgi:protocatechuate 3,4-dioxygenase alpha subunit